MSLITGVGGSGYISSLYSLANPTATPAKTDTTQGAATTNTAATASGAASSSNASASSAAAATAAKSPSLSSDLSSQILASMLSQEQSNLSTLLGSLSTGSSGSSDSLYNILKLSANYTLMKNGIDPTAVLQNAEAKLAGESGSGSSSSTDAAADSAKASTDNSNA